MKAKICGVRNVETALAAKGCGADFIGLIFAENSPRKVDIASAKKIAAAIGKDAKLVGVFQNQSSQFIEETANALNLYAVQLHGGESPEFALALAKKIRAKIWKAAWLESEEDLQNALDYPADAIVADSAKNALRGGSGEPSNWELASRLAKRKKLLLAGGISAENALEAAQKVRDGYQLSTIFQMDTESATSELCSFRGVGEKVRIFRAA